MPTIAIADDLPLYRDSFSQLCTQLGFTVVFEAFDGMDLLNKLLHECVPDVIFMDITMPNMCGKEATAIISNKYPSVKVIVLSAYVHEKHIIDMLKCGAKGYLSKAINSRIEVVEAVEQVLKGGYYFPDEMLNEWNIPAKYFTSQKNAKKYRTTLLTDREYEFVGHCASDDSYQQIADKMGLAYKPIDA